jgi:4-amino-4-deoxy-L-arabinose transferase-like glycosyltransferase
MPGSPSNSATAPPETGRAHRLRTRVGELSRSDRRALIGLGIVVVAYLGICIAALAERSAFGHDESVYALRSRDLQDGWSNLSGNYWRDYRAPGLPLLLSVVGRVLGTHVTTARFVVVLLGLAIIVVTATIGARLRSWTVGVIAAALLAVTSAFVVTTTTLLADTPGAAFGLIAIAAYLADLHRGRLRWCLIVTPVAAFAATLSRFGAPLMLAAGLTAAAVVWAPQVLRTRQWRLVAESAVLAVLTAAAAAFVVLTSTFSLDGTSPTEANQALVARNGFTWSTGLSDLIAVVNPWSDTAVHLWSRPVAVVFAVGVLASIVGAVVDRSRARIVVFGLLAGTVSALTVALSVGLVVPNYLVLAVPFWAIAAAAGWDWLASSLANLARPRTLLRPAAISIAAALFVVLAVDTANDVRSRHQSFEISGRNIRAAAVATGNALGDSCVLVARYTPQAGYYSGCLMAPFQEWEDIAAAESLARAVRTPIDRGRLGDPPYPAIAVMLVEGVNRQPAVDELSASPDLFTSEIFSVGEPGERRYTVVRVIDPCVIDRTCVSFTAP